ncbi:MAG TPA: RHS repeat-associated core domain-containing protein, partial [Pyrinomonadaceae bacterium]|nr:RHS repeat-associated core domain-containing protein [Pyrinomonadaceae bacterium]
LLFQGYSCINLTHDAAGHAFGYDAENKQGTYDGGATTNGGATYYYDGGGKRVKKVVGGPTMVTSVFVYNIAGQLIAEYGGTSGSGGTSYLTSDTLGTPRVITGPNQAIKARHDYLPFGEELSIGSGGRASAQGYVGDNLRQKFTQYEWDNESNLDYAKARYYSSGQGRFTSVDPLMRSASIGDPQTFNRYSYVLNDPMNSTDPTGLCPKGRKCYTHEDENGKPVEYYDLEDGTPVVVTDIPLINLLAALTVTTPIDFEIVYRSARVWQITPSAVPVASRPGTGGFGKFLGAVGLILSSPASIGCGQTPNYTSDGNGGCMLDPDADVDKSANPDPEDNKPDTTENEKEEKSSKDASDEKPAKDLISAGLKRSKSYHSELEDMTKADLQKLSNQRGEAGRRAKQMLKLVKEGKRLKGKGY